MRTLESRLARGEEVTNRKDTVEGQGIDGDEGTRDGEAIRRKAHIERGIGVERVDFKVRERGIGADGLNHGNSWGEPGGKGGSYRKD